jgi:uncharacterized protein YutE (UPF0331/DUF86 family)
VTEPEDDILEIICDRVQSLNIALDEDMRLLGTVPNDLTAFKAMTEHGRVGSRALLKTVEQLEDQLMRLFRTILQARAVDTKDLYARDVANRMASLRIIDSADDWMAVVKLRNRLVHDYPLTSEARFAKLVEAVRATDTLRAASQRALTYVDKKEWLA